MATIKNFQDASAYLGAKNERPFAHNTRIERVGDEAIAAKYHGHIVTMFTTAGNVYSSCGWKTITTKERINWFLPSGFRLWQEKSVWYVSDVSKGWEQAKRYIFNDGMSIAPDGSITGAGDADEQEQVKKTIKRIKKYVDGYIKALFAGEVEKPSGGDCWYCYMQTEDGESLGDATQNSNHIESHMEESYYVPSLLTRAYKHNKRMCAMTLDGIARAWEKMDISDWQKSIMERDIKASLTAYLKHQMNLAQ